MRPSWLFRVTPRLTTVLGPLALIDESMPVILLMTQDSLYDKVQSALQQVSSRGGLPVVICNEGDTGFVDSPRILRVPKTVDALQGLLTVIPLQLLSYHIACARGSDVDMPVSPTPFSLASFAALTDDMNSATWPNL